MTAPRWLGVAGLVAVAGNVGAVVALYPVPSAYRLGALEGWTREVIAHPVAASVSAAAFLVGLVALAGFALLLGAQAGTTARVGGFLVALGASLDAVGVPAPLVVGVHLGAACGAGCAPAAHALLGFSLALDAAFNLLLGVGLVLLAHDAPQVAAGWARALALLGGLASIPVALQAVWDPAQRGLAVAAPLWLAYVVAVSVRGLRRARGWTPA